MAERAGDDTKRIKGCKNGIVGKRFCPELKEVGGGFEGERYRCDRCGETFFLDYDDMK